jgi:hypothetical protein
MSDEERSVQPIHESQQPKHLVKSLFMAQPDYDPFGDRISVVQDPPEPTTTAPNSETAQAATPSPATTNDTQVDSE